VLTLCAEDTGDSSVQASVRRLATGAAGSMDLRFHRGAHPRLGSIDVVPFVSLRRDRGGRICDGPIEEAIAARDSFVTWAGRELGLPCFAYGPERSLPEVRRLAFRTLEPDAGPPLPHRTAGACAVGARPMLVAYNLWLSDPDLDLARSIAASIRSPQVRALGLRVGSSVQVSCNLTAPFETGPVAVHDKVAHLAETGHNGIEHSELVGLVPLRVLEAVPARRRSELGLDEEHSIESLLASRSVTGP
jgi:glutamate formiminotransferase / 5-formyltetrahydrofolate cyclo-ligase